MAEGTSQAMVPSQENHDAMTTKQAIDILTTLRHTCTAAEGCTGEALDVAIDLMQRNIVKADIDSIIKAVERYTGVTEEDMCKKGRQREYSEARAIVCWLAHHYTPMTLTAIGKRIGRDHAVAIYYNKAVGAWLEQPRLNPTGYRIVNKLKKELDYDNQESNRGAYKVQ